MLLGRQSIHGGVEGEHRQAAIVELIAPGALSASPKRAATGTDRRAYHIVGAQQEIRRVGLEPLGQWLIFHAAEQVSAGCTGTAEVAFPCRAGDAIEVADANEIDPFRLDVEAEAI